MRLGRRVNVTQDIDQTVGLPQDLGPNDIGSSLAWKRAGAALFQPRFTIDFVVWAAGQEMTPKCAEAISGISDQEHSFWLSEWLSSLQSLLRLYLTALYKGRYQFRTSKKIRRFGLTGMTSRVGFFRS